MIKEQKFTDTKVLPFEGAQGHVPGHEIRRFYYDWLEDAIKSVVFETFDRKAEMKIEHVVHWTRWTQYEKKLWPSGASIVAVLLENGRRVHAEGLYAVYNDESGYLGAPIVCRDCIEIVTLGKGYKLLEVVGALEYMRKRTPLVDPWERDNKAFQERMSVGV